MKKFPYIMICILLTVLLSSCTGRIVAEKPSTSPSSSSAPAADSSAVRTGLSVIADASESTSAGSEDGTAKTTVDLVALTVDDKGVIRSCEIDSVDTVIRFDPSGALLTDPTDTIYSKDELGEDYGMHTASDIGEEWDEQADAMADYAVGKTVEEIKNIAVDERGRPSAADLTSSVTISVTDFITGIENAVENAHHLGAKANDDLELVSITEISKSSSADGTAQGAANTESNIAAVTYDGEIITSCIFDAVQVNIGFDANGRITDLPDPIPTKNALGRDYGMHTASTVDKDWNEQAAFFAEYLVGKTYAEVMDLSLDEKGSPADPDLTSSVTLSVSDFLALIAKASE